MSNNATEPQSTNQVMAQPVPVTVPLPVPPINLPQNMLAQQQSNQTGVSSIPSQIYQVPSSQTIAPDIAEDTDLIEKEWVEKAKQIVERTRDDPYEQSKELTLFKADYMKKRYNRTIKIGE